ncbi:transposase [Streptomyces tauricus]|uniref:transposase n=1 Tax=Streptomyces tauricus TaxID=68274 RepID=UPI0038B69CDD
MRLRADSQILPLSPSSDRNPASHVQPSHLRRHDRATRHGTARKLTVAILHSPAPTAAPTKLNISGHTYLQARFAESDCQPCPDRTRCTSSTTRPRSVAVLPQTLHEVQTRNRLDQQTEQWQHRYAIRAGTEATLSQNVRAHGLRRSRYRGLTRTHVQHVLTAMACNLSRLADWHDTTSSGRRASLFRTLCNTAGFAST